MGRTKILVPESNHELLKKNFWENFLSPEGLVVVGGGEEGRTQIQSPEPNFELHLPAGNGLKKSYANFEFIQ